jgi:hypothetical protein
MFIKVKGTENFGWNFGDNFQEAGFSVKIENWILKAKINQLTLPIV